MSFKMLLIVANAPRHAPFIGDLHPRLKVALLYPNTMSVIQTIHREVKTAFKTYPLRKTFAQAVAAPEEDTENTPRQQ